MKKMTILVLGASLISVPAITYAQGPDGSSEQSENSTKDNDPEQRIKCKRLAVTGSLIKKQKICRTIAQWKEITRGGNRYAGELLDEANRGSTNGR